MAPSCAGFYRSTSGGEDAQYIHEKGDGLGVAESWPEAEPPCRDRGRSTRGRLLLSTASPITITESV